MCIRDRYQRRVHGVLALIVIDNEGTRLLAKYYDMDLKTVDEQLEFEKRLFIKSSKMTSKASECDILNIDQYIVVFRCYFDVSIFMVGSIMDNELALAEGMETLHLCLEQVYKEGIERKNIIHLMTVFLLLIDEIIDHGIIQTLSSEEVLAEIEVKAPSAINQAFSSVVSKITSQIAKSSYL
eukprot:TRINITY_DN4974_c0_g1_i3.p1 TRINITY_DN4974_c0_g1~~TRINITY_DN4974_c0_g1_i3.p1  ORF type:complete len:182 (-),score=38.74 TRINITY_DN4974_c0_g1_i3:241-786(-)